MHLLSIYVRLLFYLGVCWDRDLDLDQGLTKTFLFHNNGKGIDDSLYRIINMSFLLVSLPTQIGAGSENGGLKKLTGL